MLQRDRNNNFGLLRLLFAALVVLSHSPELIDGNRSREILTRLFGTLSFGEVGVDGFFIISGYLVAKSYLTTSSLLDFLVKRVARILPAFVVASIVSIALFGPIAHSPLAELGLRDWRHVAIFMFLLQPPPMPAFSGLPIPALNGAMWTIAYEFRCYLLLAGFGSLGILGRKAATPLIAAALFIAQSANIFPNFNPNVEFFGTLVSTARLTAIFLVGVSFYLFRERISYRARYAGAAALGLFAAMHFPRFAEPAFAVLGGYLVFFAAFRTPVSNVALLTNRQDISYGLYLYAWPIQSSLCYLQRDMSPWLLFAISLSLSAAFGLASWKIVEAPVLRLVKGPGAPDDHRAIVGSTSQTGAHPLLAVTTSARSSENLG
jgi:peptidoglycan/LPS O-acetylase OafA/YrhL